MSKFSIFTIFLSATIVVIVAELLVNEYIKYPELKGHISANVLTSDLSQESNSADSQNPANEKNSNPSDTHIAFSTIEAAGFKDVTLQRVPFNGILFENLDLRDFQSVPIVQQNLLKNNRTTATTASFYEFTCENEVLAREVYSLLREKSGKLIGAVINETNEFGDNSFYVNFFDRKESVFLVVKLEDNVYALTYQKEHHSVIKQLITLLSPT